MRFDHGVVAVRDLQHAIHLFHDFIGLAARPGGRHAGRGTENAIIRFRDSYIELLSLFDAEKEIAVSGLRGRVLADFITDREGGLAGYSFTTTEIVRQAEALRGSGLDVPEPLAVSRMVPAGHTLRWRVLLPEGVNWRRPWPFLIQADPANADHEANEPPGDHPLGATGVAGVTVIVERIDRVRALYGKHLGLELQREDRVPELAADRARFIHEGFTVDLLAPVGAGPVRSELDSAGEGLFQLLLRVANLDAARAWLARSGIALQPAPGQPGGWLIPPERAAGARLALIEGNGAAE